MLVVDSVWVNGADEHQVPYVFLVGFLAKELTEGAERYHPGAKGECLRMHFMPASIADDHGETTFARELESILRQW